MVCLVLPQVSQEELEAIARGEGAAGMDVDTYGAGGEATRRLLGDYQTPARYIAASHAHDACGAAPDTRACQERQAFHAERQHATA